MLDAAQIRRRFPAFTPAPETVALFENEAGIVFPEEAIRAHLDFAVDNGAHVHFDERVEEWNVTLVRGHRATHVARRDTNPIG